MIQEQEERLQNELSLLDSMYAEEVAWNSGTRELKYASGHRSLQVRLPDGYLLDQLPQVLAASVEKRDAREKLRSFIQTCELGEEVLDSVILFFIELSESPEVTSEDISAEKSARMNESLSRRMTVVVWLHHLLNTNKRKLASSPTAPNVSGVTKPGYPGVLIFSGPENSVMEHVNTLKRENWQAFQIRLEEQEEWTFAHGNGVKEVETMKEVMAEIGVERKSVFMEAMRMK